MRALPAFILALAGCYSPDARNCTVSCASAMECGNGQICGADGFCAAPNVAGHCNAANPDAAVPQANVALRITIQGQGRVSIAGIGVCDSMDASRDCTLMVPPHVARMLAAVETEQNFVGWTTMNCANQGSICTLTPITATQVGARFK
ncbi:MAG: hypothetical protein JWO36_384 [Myxococcales bacterium]|nr:hypothetical protein [Myxococcales bacterium]